MFAAAKHSGLSAITLVLLLVLAIASAAGGARGGKADKEPPTAPTNVHVESATASSVMLAWDPSTDAETSVAGYYVFVNGQRARVSTTSYLAEGLPCGEGVGVWVVAYDKVNNRSEAASATVSTAPCPDIDPPTPPTGFRQDATTQDAIVLSWQPSRDNVGVVGYGVYRNVGRVASPTEPTVTLSGLECGVTYAYQVDAVDAAGNRSGLENVFVETASCDDSDAPTPPADLETTSRSATSISLAWSPATDNVAVAGYEVSVAGKPALTVTGTSATVSDLTCRTTYAVSVRAFDGAGNRSSAATTDAFTDACSAPPPPSDTNPPSAPTRLGATNVTQTSLTLTWGASTDDVGVTGYDVYRDGSKTASVTGTSSTQSSLACGVSYSFAVAARDAAGNSSPPAEVEVSTAQCSSPAPPPPPPSDTTPPTTPANLGLSGATRTSVTLSWRASSDDVGVAGYRVYVDGTAGSTTSQTTATVSGLACGTAYTFAVDAYDAAGNRSPKASVIGSTAACADTQPPTAPTNVVATSRTATSIALSWSASSDNVGVTGYGLYRGGSRVGTGSGTTGIFSGLACGTSYTLGVDAYDAAGNRSSQTVVMVSTTACADTTPPSAPTGLTASNVTQTGLTLGWSASTDNVAVTAYDVYRSGSVVATVSATSASQTGLACGTQYWFGVVARDAAGNSSPKTSIQATTAACSAPPPPPPSPTPGGPITITRGGTYSGNWASTSSTPAVTIATTEPVTIVDSTVTNLAGGTLINATPGGAVQVTIERVRAYGGASTATSGRFFTGYNFKSVTIRNCTIENTRGIEATYGVSGSSILITRNRHRNIQGSGKSPVGNFVQLRVVQSATVEISWNEIVNEYGKSNPEDIISLYHSSNSKVHDNMLWHQSKPGNDYNTSSQSGITIDSSTSGPGSNNNEIYNNQVVDGMGILAWLDPGAGSNNMLRGNRVVQDGKLPDGVTRIGNGYRGMRITTSGTNNHAHDNVVGYVNRDGSRVDWYFDGAAEGDAVERVNNTPIPGTISGATEQAEWALWQQKLAANAVSIGA